MSYANNINRDSIENEYFATMNPRVLMPKTGRSLYSGVTYMVSQEHFVTEMASANIGSPYTSLTLGASKDSLADFEFFYDSENKILYWRLDAFGSDNAGANPFDFVLTVELYLSTKDVMWYRDPLDETTDMVKWVGCIKSPPVLSMISDVQNFGFVPNDVTQMVCNNDRETFQYIIHRGSFSRADVVVWHQCGDLEIDNIDRIITGSVDNRLTYNNNQITFPLADRFLDFDDVVNYGTSTENYFNEATFGSGSVVDPDFVDKPIRMVYGVVKGFTPVNVDYNGDAPSTGNNRKWVVGHGQGQDFWDSYSATIVAAVGSDSFKVAAADGKFFAIGDRVWVDKGTDQWGTITAITDDGAGNFILQCGKITGTTFSGIAFGDIVSKSYVRNAYLVDTQNSQWYQFEFGRDYTESTFVQNTSGITFNGSAEANAGAPTYSPGTHHIFFDVAGKQTLPTVGGLDFDQLKGVAGSYSTDPAYLNTYGAFNRIAIVIYDFLKNVFGMDEADIDTARLLDLDMNIDQSQLGCAIPQSAGDSEFPTFKEVLNDLFVGCFSRGFFNQDGIFTIRTLQKIVTADASFLKEDMIDAAWQIEYSDMAKIVISPHSENMLIPTYGTKIGLTDFHTHFKYKQDENIKLFSNALSNGTYALLNKLTKTTTPDQKLFVNNGDGTGFPANRLLYASIYSDRSAKLTFTVKNEGISLNIGDSIEVTRDDLPGFEPGSDNSMFLTIVGIKKGNGQVEITADDQRLIQEG